MVLRNDLAQALLDADPLAAGRIAQTLQGEFGPDAMLAPAAVLIEHIQWQKSRPAEGRLELAAVLDARERLEGPVASAATSVFGAQQAGAWLAGQWCWLAWQARDIAWCPAQAEAHAAALYLRGQAWSLAADAVARIESWRRIPLPLQWMAHARWCRDGADAAWPLLAEALWLAPARAAALLRALADPELRRLVERFEERFDPVDEAGADWAWLPAFALVERPLLAGALESATAPADSAPGRAFETVTALLRLERRGRHHEIVAHRARLKSLSAPLFAAYMATR